MTSNLFFFMILDPPTYHVIQFLEVTLDLPTYLPTLKLDFINGLSQMKRTTLHFVSAQEHLRSCTIRKSLLIQENELIKQQ